jgi:hypothetical protein
MQPNGQCHSGWLTVEFCEVIAICAINDEISMRNNHISEANV